jgi:hypothetical protein
MHASLCQARLQHLACSQELHQQAQVSFALTLCQVKAQLTLALCQVKARVTPLN